MHVVLGAGDRGIDGLIVRVEPLGGVALSAHAYVDGEFVAAPPPLRY